MQIIEEKNKKIALIDQTECIHSVEDALDLMANARYLGNSNHLVCFKESLHEDFFDLKTRLAGDILQKFSNYNVCLAIVGDFSMYTSKALKDFIHESNKGKRVCWVSNLEEALAALLLCTT